MGLTEYSPMINHRDNLLNLAKMAISLCRGRPALIYHTNYWGKKLP